MFNLARKFKPDIITGINNTIAAHVSKVTNAKSIIFTDTEHATLANNITFPFSNVVCTPSCFKKDIGKKQVRYDGYHELAYLHPNYFKPNSAVLEEIGLSKDEIFFILRFVTWGASHDIGQHGIQDRIKLIHELEKYGRVLISSEGPLDMGLEKYNIKVSPDKMHDLLYYATLYLGEGATMATESAILGTPSIYVSSLVGTMGNFIELEQKYGLMYNYNDSDKAMKKAVELIQKPQIKKEWSKKRETLLKDKINVTEFMVWFIEDFPKSLEKIKDNGILG
jgi:predicted glycosyltransferase